MIHDCQRKTVSVIQLGQGINSTVVDQTLYLANQVQRSFHFELRKEVLPLFDTYRLLNGGFDLCEAGESLLHSRKYRKLPRPLILLSSEPFGEQEHGHEPGWFFFYSQEEDYDPQVSIISTQPLEVLPKTRTLQHYLLVMLAMDILTKYADMGYHQETRGCLFDYCDELKDLENCFRIGRLCDECERVLQNRIRRSQISLDRVAAAIRLFNRAVGRKYCFLVMPFSDEFKLVYEIVRQALMELGWDVKRADEVTFPRLITSLVLKEILTSDLVIADLSTYNPNVFYEVGVTQVIGNDLLMITQEKDTPFDIKNEQIIFYQPDNQGGLQDLKRKLKQFAGSGLV